MMRSIAFLLAAVLFAVPTKGQSRVVAGSAGNSVLDGDVTDGLVSQWTIEEGSGTTTEDVVGTSDCSLLDNDGGNGDGDTPPQWVGGGSGTWALDFDGTDDYADCGTATTVVSTTPLSIVVVFKMEADASGFLASANSPEMELWYSGSNALWLDGSGSAQNFSWTYDTSWHVVIYTDAGSGTYTAYLDGSSQSLSGSASLASQSNFYLGARSADNKISALIDEVRVYNKVLSSAEASQLSSYLLP